MKSPMFAPAAVACLVDGRAPNADEIDQLASKIWHDAYASTAAVQWSEVDRGSRLYRSVQAAALVSLGAVATFGTGLIGNVG